MTVKKNDFCNIPKLLSFSQLSVLLGKHPNIVSRDFISDPNFPAARVIGGRRLWSSREINRVKGDFC